MVRKTKITTTSLIFSALALAGAGLCAGHAAAQSDEQGLPPAAEAAPLPPPAAPAPPKTANKKKEVLPWENTPVVPQAEAPAAPADPAVAAAAAQCTGLFEAACRDLKTCAWVGDVALQDGTLVPARCLVRPPAPPKTAKKAAPVAKKTAVAPEGADTPAKSAAPAVKASVTRIEDEAAHQAEAETPKKAKVAKPAKTAVTEQPAVTEPAPPANPVASEVGTPEAGTHDVSEKAPAAAEETQHPAAQAEAPPAKEDAAKAEPHKHADAAQKKLDEAHKAPIVVTPPAVKPPTQAPSFGSFSAAMPSGDAVVVTVPPSE